LNSNYFRNLGQMKIDYLKFTHLNESK